MCKIKNKITKNQVSDIGKMVSFEKNITSFKDAAGMYGMSSHCEYTMSMIYAVKIFSPRRMTCSGILQCFIISNSLNFRYRVKFLKQRH